ncbi:hypothetical protein ACLESO_47985 [Pyxidicoccus sp. 3LG]
MTAHSPAAPSDSTTRPIASGLFLLAALFLAGGTLGLAVGVPLDKALRPDSHGFPGLLGLLVGTPAGALLGLVAGLWRLKRLSYEQRLRFGVLALGVAAVAACGLYGAVLLGIMSW